MTLPDLPSQQDAINVAANTNAVAERTQLLQNQHPWLDPNTTGSLAASSDSDQTILAAAGSFKSVLDQAASAAGSAISQIGHFFEDPVLAKKPSAALMLQQYLMQRQGWLPVGEADLKAVQRQLQAKGYGGDLTTSGVWTPDWQQQFRQASSDHLDAAAKSNNGAGMSFGKATHGFLSGLMPSHWIPAVWGAAKALPGETRDLASEVWGDLGGVSEGVMHPSSFLGGSGAQQKVEATRSANSASVQTALGNPQTAEENSRERWQQFLGSINALLTVSAGGKLASVAGSTWVTAQQAVKDAGGEGIAKGLFTDLGADAAKRGPGVVSQTLYRYGPNGQRLGLLNTRLFANSPVLKQLTMPLRAVANPLRAVANPQGAPAGYYYTARTLLAQPYRIAGVQIAGSLGQQAALTGAGARGVAAIESKIGGRHTGLDDQIYAQHTIGGAFGVALDLLGGALHGPLHAGEVIGTNPSRTVADIVHGGGAKLDAALRPLGVQWAFEAGTGLKYADLVAKVGEPDAQWFLNSKINEFAAAHYAHSVVDGSGLVGNDWLEAFKNAAHTAYHDPELLDQHRADMLSNLAELPGRFFQDSNAILGDTNLKYAKGIASLMPAWHDAYRLFNQHKNELVTPVTREAIRTAAQDRQFEADMGGQVGAEPGAYRGWLQSNNPTAERGAFGIARLETQTKQDALRKANRLAQDMKAAIGNANTEQGHVAENMPAYRRVLRDARDYATGEFGLRDHELERLDLPATIDLIRDKADTLARDVHLPLDPAPEASALVRSLAGKGYKPVFGTDIGHQFAPPTVDPLVIDGAATSRRKFATALGLNNLPVSTTATGALRREAVIRSWQTAVNDGTLRLPPHWNASRMWEFLHTNLESRAELSKAEGAAFSLSRSAFKNDIENRASILEATGMDRAKALTQATQDIKAHIARGTQPLEVTQKQFMKALMQPAGSISNELRDEAFNAPLLDEKSARLAHGLYLSSMASEPLWAFGLGKIEDLARAGFGFLGSRPAQVPIVNRIAVLPNELARFRNKYRFTLDPMFSARRITKTALKLGLEGVPFSVRPYETMVKQGTLNDDLAALNRIMPDKTADGFDNMDRALHQQDVFGLFNPRHFMALAAGHWKRAGLDDTEVKRLLAKAVTYGDRTAAERTVSTFFYPFSFEKTLYRNLGGYMLDHPGQRLAVAAAVQAYDALSKHANIGDWLKQHAPILKEFQKLNAFNHGVGPGELGGINSVYASALWNVFGPQKLGANAMKEPGLNVVLQTLPVLRDLNSMLYGENVYTGEHHGGTLTQQLKIGYWGLRNAADDVTRWATGDPRSPWNPQHPATTYQAEQNNAWAFRNAMIIKLAPVLDYNYHHQGSELRFTGNPNLPETVQGMPITRSAIGKLVHRFYPDFDPSIAQTLAVEKQTEEKRYLADLRTADPQHADFFDGFAKTAAKIVPAMQRAEMNPDTWSKFAEVTAAFRSYAVNMSEQDPRFLAFYNKFYATRFGPITELSL